MDDRQMLREELTGLKSELSNLKLRIDTLEKKINNVDNSISLSKIENEPVKKNRYSNTYWWKYTFT